MMITDNQRNTIKESLQSQGLTFKPLLEEMIDHICCDVEVLMDQGHSFDEAFQITLRDIPKDHFKTIQTNIMETINKRFTASQWLSYTALGLLFSSLIFKILHLQFTGLLLIASFVFIAISLLTSTVSGINLNREKDGALRVLGVIAGIIILIIGYSFKLLHLPGGSIITYWQ